MMLRFADRYTRYCNNISVARLKRSATLTFPSRSNNTLLSGHFYGCATHRLPLMPGVFDGADLNFVAKVRAGFVPHSRCEVFQRLKGLETEKCPLPIRQRRKERYGRSLPRR